MKTNRIHILFLCTVHFLFLGASSKSWSQEKQQRSLRLTKVERTFTHISKEQRTKLSGKLQELTKRDLSEILGMYLDYFDIEKNKIHLTLRCEPLKENELRNEIRKLKAQEVQLYEGILTAWLPLDNIKNLEHCLYLIKAWPLKKPEILVKNNSSNITATTISGTNHIKQSKLPELKSKLVSNSN